jgi:hypothetical protein
MKSSKNAYEFNKELFNLAERLAKNDIVISRLYADWGSFGSWIIHAQKGNETEKYSDAILNREYDTWGPIVLRITWDGKESFLLIEQSPTPPLSSPNAWQKIFSKNIKKKEFKDLISFVEKKINEWINNNA